ncbi:hypothetical protein [Streptomyces orinoci]|uniref:Uncharacterized protein n=1 Tax=Streptomyces orinoci TaxID=67339 RepID=A0ABV3K1B3_STRON|nr:hypothetical protein [Streptomyces orinoci]
MQDSADNFRTTFIFGAPNETPRGWELSLEHFAAALLRRDPDAFTHMMSSPLLGDMLTFTFRTSEGEREGNAGPDPDGVGLNDCTAGEAAEFAQWLRQEIVPPGASIDFNIRPAAEVDLPNRRLSDPVNAEVVLSELLAYVRDILAAQERGEM